MNEIEQKRLINLENELGIKFGTFDDSSSRLRSIEATLTENKNEALKALRNDMNGQFGESKKSYASVLEKLAEFMTQTNDSIEGLKIKEPETKPKTFWDLFKRS